MMANCEVYEPGEANLGGGIQCKICLQPVCHECLERDSPGFDGEYPALYCRSCMEKYGKESIQLNGLSPNSTPTISPAPSLSSYWSSASSSGGFPADGMNGNSRETVDEILDTGQQHADIRFTEHQEELGNGNVSNISDTQSSHLKTSYNGSVLPMSTDEMSVSGSLVPVNHDGGNGDKIGVSNGLRRDARSIAGDDSEWSENATIDKSMMECLSKIETDPLIWLPPEPEDMESEMDSVANNDDDDEFSDGTKWGQPSSLGSLDEVGYKEERQKAMLEAMNGQFKFLVSRFLASEEISDGGSVDNWLDIVASLSWEAALLVKPDASEGRAMDPVSYVKVKCIATGIRSQSEVIKGLVFKKNTAHKHMPTKYKNPRLLLLKGVLGQSAVRLSSFNSMEQEMDSLKSIIEMIEACQPNVVLVEKSVSRDLQESLLAKEITLAFDMKLTRLEKIARCTGSQIVSAGDMLAKPKLKQCDYFHIEKLMEEHNGPGENGKRASSKTLMFLEGFSKPLGCTILLKGADSDELKKIKRVIHYTVFAAYHLIVETSFYADQRALFSGIHFVSGKIDHVKDKSDSAVYELDVPIANGSLEKSANEFMRPKSDLDAEESLKFPIVGSKVDFTEKMFEHRDMFYHNSNSDGSQLESSVPLLPGQLLSSVSASVRRYLGESFPPLTPDSISSYFGFKEKQFEVQNDGMLPSSPSEVLSHLIEANGETDHEKPDIGIINIENSGFMSDSAKSIEYFSDDGGGKAHVKNKDEIEPKSILVLLSSLSVANRTICEQSHLSRIKYYGNFDMSLGRYLQEILLNQKHSCASCGEPTDAHVYRYTHQNGNLTVLVKKLPSKLSLSGENEGKIWMWTRCLKCEHESGIPRSTQRVVMSPAARSLSFGKFLELSFSSHSAASRLSRCGHSLHRDCLRFFGSGSKVAMFRYSPVDIYATCKPQPVIQFRSLHKQEWLRKEAQDVLAKGNRLFAEVSDLLQKLKTKFSSSPLKKFTNLNAVKEFHEVEEMLMNERAEFEVSLMKAINGGGASEIIDLNWLYQELLFELYVWDRRLHFLLLHARDGNNTRDAISREHFQQNVSSHDLDVGRITMANDSSELEVLIDIPIDGEESSSSSGSHHKQYTETVLEVESTVSSGNTIDINQHSYDDAGSAVNRSLSRVSSAGSMTEIPTDLGEKEPNGSTSDLSLLKGNNGDQEECIPILDHMQTDQTIPVRSEPLGFGELELKDDGASSGGETSAAFPSEKQTYVSHETSTPCVDDKGWIWSPFSELRKSFRNDLHGGCLNKFDFIHSYAPEHLLPVQQSSTQEMDCLHFPVGTGINVISALEDEISSIISCALALSEDQYGLFDNVVEESGDGKGEARKSFDNSYSFPSERSVASSNWTSTGSLEPEGMRSSQSLSSSSSDEFFTSVSDSALSIDRLIACDSLHPEIPLGLGKAPGKGKYSVVCIHAKQFYVLRKRCCPSELAYISSLSRCKKWDAQGGKSKAFFAKTMDDRFIIKQIKKTELDSFLKFAPEYFKHISHSLDSGSQTCLAKILGIYQVRQNKHGKEVKIDLMVMENLLFGRNISRTYDLKGAVLSRYISGANDAEKVLLDLNFVEDMCLSPIYIGGRTKQLLQRAIWNDTNFLTSINVMDYSLLVGVDKQRHEIVFGIIDYLRQYTWDKQLETWVKSSLVVPKNALPTVISPRDYKKRFRKFLSKYFLTVPDDWRPEPSSPRRYSIDGCSDSSLLQNSSLPEGPIVACA